MEKDSEEKTISALLREIREMEIVKLNELSKKILDKSREQTAEVIRIMHSEDNEQSKKAATLLLGLEDAAFSPLLVSLIPEKPLDYVWEAGIAVDINLDSRKKLTGLLNSMLLDTRVVPTPQEESFVEEKPPVARICDHAYIMLRKILAHKETDLELMQNERTFLKGDFKQRDKEIERIKSTQEWISLAEKFFEG